MFGGGCQALRGPEFQLSTLGSSSASPRGALCPSHPSWGQGSLCAESWSPPPHCAGGGSPGASQPRRTISWARRGGGQGPSSRREVPVRTPAAQRVLAPPRSSPCPRRGSWGGPWAPVLVLVRWSAPPARPGRVRRWCGKWPPGRARGRVGGCPLCRPSSPSGSTASRSGPWPGRRSGCSRPCPAPA